MWIEAAIDFPEEEIDFLATPMLIEDLEALREQFADLLAATRRGVRLRDGLHVVIVGPPNAGKSSLLNKLAASERAIVTDVPGTTRDVLRETIDLDGMSLTLVDTAGLRESTDVVEVEGIRRARAELERADLALLVTRIADIDDDRALLDVLPPSARRLIVCNKIDLDGTSAGRQRRGNDTVLLLSARSGDGLDLLIDELKSLAGVGDPGDGAFSARAHVRVRRRGARPSRHGLHRPGRPAGRRICSRGLAPGAA
jgi:tRNA modification GTPase